jgi:signal transduction histidine kinase
MRRIKPYLASTLIVLLSTAVRYALVPWLGLRFPLLTYVPAVELIAYFFGFRPAMVSIALSLVIGRVLFIQPLHPLLFPPPESVAFCSLFVLFCASLSMFMENLRQARQAAEAHAALAREHMGKLEEEMAARQRERSWSDSVLASIADGVIASDAAGNVTYMNTLAEELTGWTRTEAKHQPVSRVFYAIEQPPFTLLSATDGRMIPVEHTVSAIRDNREQELGKVIVFRDVTERQIAQKALEASERRLHASLLAAGAAAWEWDQRTNEIICSAEFRELTGLRDMGNYMHFGALLAAIHPDDRLPMEEELASAARMGDEFRLEYRLLRRGEVRWLGLMGRLAAPERVVGIVVDLTERRRLEEKLRDAAKQESLGVLSGGIAHDFNNLLTGILGYASMLRSEFPEDSRVAGYAAEIEESSKRAAHLTQQILAYSGQGRFSLETTHLSAHVVKTIEDLRPVIGANITLELDLDDDLPLVSADPHQLEQVSRGILLNAVEAIGEKPGTVSVATFARYLDGADAPVKGAAAGNYVVFEVRDTGCGMDEATKNRIFDPFFTTKFTGRGLGLAAVLGIMRGHQGGIHVESMPGVGSAFQIFWPAVADRIAHGA